MKFFVISHPNQLGQIQYKEEDYPFVELLSDNWNDYGYETLFTAYYYQSPKKESINLGAVKILHKTNQYTRSIIPDSFTRLELNRYCSLGQTMEYYKKLKSFGDEVAQEILNGLRDIAIYKRYYNEFPKEGINDSFLDQAKRRKLLSQQFSFLVAKKERRICFSI